MLKLKAAPTFKAPVTIRAPGGQEHKVTIEFKHRTRDALNAFMASEEWSGQTDAQNVLAIACGWEGVDGEFGEAALEELFQNYQSAPAAIVTAYLSELTLAKLGN